MGLDQKERVHTESSVNGGVDHNGQVSQNRWENSPNRKVMNLLQEGMLTVLRFPCVKGMLDCLRLPSNPLPGVEGRTTLQPQR